MASLSLLACRKVQYFVCTYNEGSGEPAWVYRINLTFPARMWDNVGQHTDNDYVDLLDLPHRGDYKNVKTESQS